jgi:hypothetical protein
LQFANGRWPLVPERLYNPKLQPAKFGRGHSRNLLYYIML